MALTSPEREAKARATAVRRARWFCAIALVAYPAFGLSGIWRPELIDPLLPRLLLTALIAAALVATYVSERVRANVRLMLQVAIYLVTIHAYALLALNKLHPGLAIAVLIVLAGFIATATDTMRSARDIAAYLLFTLIAAGAASLFALDAAPAVPPLDFMIALVAVVTLAWVAVSSQLAAVQRLERNERDLSADIARRERAERDLRASEARALAIIHAVPDALVRLDSGGVIREVHNDTDAEHPLADYIGQPLDAIVGEEHGGELRGTVADVLAGRAAAPYGCTLVWGRHVEVRLAPSGDDEVLVLISDVSERQAIEAQLRVNDRLTALGTLAAGVGHEINNPLTYILGNIHFCLDQLQPSAASPSASGKARDGVTDDVIGALEDALTGSTRIRTIVADLQSYGEGEDAITSVVLDDTAQWVLRVLDNQLKHRAHIQLDLRSTVPARANPSRMIQVLTNLVLNALQAMPAERPPTDNEIAVRTRDLDDGRVELVVADNGVGIGAEELARVFDPFFTTKSDTSGTGLGLYLCHRFVRAVGGEIGVESTPGEGTRVRVVLARAEPALAAPPAESVAPPRARVLVVDDEIAVGRSLGRLLGAHDVTVVTSVQQALEVCRETPPDAIVCDVMMPHEGGDVLYKRLAERQRELVDRIIFISGGAFLDEARRFLQSVSNPLLDKPFTRAQLLGALDGVLTAAAAGDDGTGDERPRV